MSQTKAQLIDPVDGTIVNADINASAAIAGSKISPDFGSQNIVTTGSISGAAGTLTGDLTIPDTIVHTGDTNTKIRFPAADTVSIETGGSERLRIDSSGRLQQGSDTSNLGSAKLNIVTGGEDGISIGRNTTGAVSSGEVLGTYAFQSSIGSQTTNSAEASIKGIAAQDSTGSTAATDLAFFTKPSGTGPGSSPTERLRISSSGKVGIGLDSPTRMLQIKSSGANSTHISLVDNDSTNEVFRVGQQSDGDGFVQVLDDAGQAQVGLEASGDSYFVGGKLGIGLSTPNRPLTVQSNGGQMSINDTDNTNGGIFCNAGTFSFYARGNSQLGDGSTGGVFEVQTHEGGGSTSQKFRIGDSGKLSTGGEGSPDVGNGGLCIQKNADSNKAITVKNTNIAHGVTTYDETDTFFSLGQSSGSRGGVEIRGYTDATPNASTDPAISLRGIIASDADAGSQGLRFVGAEANGTGVQNIANDRYIASFQNADLGKVVNITGTGITFGSDTAVANALNDYEEGSWTPTTTRWSVSESTSNAGKYTKIGNFVQISWNQSLTVVNGGYTGGGSGAAIGGLPFTVADCIVAVFSGSTLWTSTMKSMDNIGNEIFYRPNQYSSAGVATDAMFNSSGVVKLTATYRTND